MGKYAMYAVKNGKKPDGSEFTGIVNTWNECYLYTHGIENVKFKGFGSEADAKEWLNKVDDEQPVRSSKREKKASKNAYINMANNVLCNILDGASDSGISVEDLIKELNITLEEYK